MKDIHKLLLKSYIKLKKILDDSNIDFVARGGTAIGALREKGFIEWDDDIDIMIKEEDYEKFQNIINTTNGLSLENMDGKRPTPFDKVYFNDIEMSWRGRNDYLFIDVFKGYKMRKVSKLKKMFLKSLDYLLHIKCIKLKDISKEYNKFFIFPAILIKAIPLTTLKLKKMYDKSVTRSKVIDTSKRKSYFSYSFKHGENIWSDFSNIEEHKFESTTMYVDKGFANRMKPVFGDIYKRPQNDSITNHGIEIKPKH